MKTKTIIQLIALSLIVIFIIYQQYTISHLRNQIETDNTAIEEANTVSEPADNRDEIIQEQDDRIAQLERELLEKHNEENYQPVNITIDKPIPDVNTYIDFVPDWSPELEEMLKTDTRIAKYRYVYEDTSNDYSLAFNILYEYNRQNFIIEPSELTYEPPKKYNLTTSVLIASSGYGIMIDKDIWRFNIGVGGIVTKDIEGIALIKIGFRL